MMKNIFTIAIILAALPAFAQFVPNTNVPPIRATALWDRNAPNPTNQTSGYKVYWGTAPRIYSFMTDAGDNTSALITNLLAGRTYYFAVTAYRTSDGLESNFSTEVPYTTPFNPPPPTPGGLLIFITNNVQSSISPTGPWITKTTYVAEAWVPTNDPLTFVRQQSEVAISP